MDHILASEPFRQNGSVVGVLGDRGADHDLFIIRQFHGGRDTCIPKLVHDPEFAARYIEHHNQIRCLCALLLKDSGHLIVEGFPIQGYESRDPSFAAKFRDLERRIADDSLNLPTDLTAILSPDEIRNSLRDSSDFDFDSDEEMEAFNEVTGGRFLNGYFERLIGSFRQAADLVLSKRSERVHGMELSYAQGKGLPEYSHEFGPQDRIEFDRRRIQNVIDSFLATPEDRKKAALVIGASHCKSGSPSPVIQGVHYLEEYLPQHLPQTRITVIEPHTKVWDTVEWSAD